MVNILKEKLKVLNLGLQDFYEDLNEQSVQVQQIDWKPPGVSGDLEKDLDKLL